MHPTIRRVFNAQQSGLILVILLLGAILTIFAGSHIDHMTGRSVNNFLNIYTLTQTATDASFFAIMAVGATLVIISGGIDLSVGSIYALAGTATAMALRSWQFSNPFVNVLAGLTLCLGIGLLCGLANGVMVVGPAGASIYYHAGDDVGVSRDRVRDQQSGEHSRTRRADQRGQDDVRLGLGAVPGADARDDRRHGARGDLSLANGDGAAHLRDWRQRRGQPLFGAAAGAHPDRRVRAVGADGRHCGVRRQQLLWIGDLRGRDGIRIIRDRRGGGRRREPERRQRQRDQCHARRDPHCADSAGDPPIAFRPELRMDHHRLRDHRWQWCWINSTRG